MGTSSVTADRLASFAASHGAPLVSDWPTLAATYIAEGTDEGVAGDLAFCQMLHETAFLRFGGDVQPSQNNFAGLGATGGGAAGASFPDMVTGVRAQIQHLHRYASRWPLRYPSVDPRQTGPYAGSCPTWESLDGHWAVPGVGYGESIVALHLQAGVFMETWCPFATIERGPYDDGSHGGPVTSHLGVVMHVTTNWADPGPYFSQPINGASSHFWIRKDGEIVEYLPLDVASWAQAAGNYSYVSVETDGVVDVALSTPQVASFAKLYAWVEHTQGFGFALAEVPGQPGLGWHGMGGAAWGGHTGCPGDIRKAQRAVILLDAQGQPPPVPPTPTVIIVTGDADVAAHIDFSIQTDTNGAGWTIIPVDADHIVSLLVHDVDPAVVGSYGHFEGVGFSGAAPGQTKVEMGSSNLKNASVGFRAWATA